MLAQILTLLCAISITLSQSAMPQSLGILINYELGVSQKFKNYVKHFHDPVCTAVTEFNVVVSAQAAQQVKQMQNSLKSLERVIPINYIFTSEGENYHFRMRASNSSKADIYYLSKMNVQLEGCESIMKFVFIAQRKAVSGVMGLVGQHDSLSSISSDLIRLKNQFLYTKQTPQHFALVQNIRLVSRHILQLSQSNINQVARMRKQTKPICEDIFLNFVASHFYPELRPSFEQFQSLFLTEKINQNSDKQKSNCIKKYVEILGYLPVFYHRKEFKKEVWVNPNLPQVIELKKLQLLGELYKQKGGQRLLPAITSKESEISQQQKSPKHEYLSTGSKEIILTVLRVITIALCIVLGFLGIQSLLFSSKQKNGTTN